MYYRYFSLTLLFCFVICFIVGCGEGYPVTGKVTFPDGNPLTVGRVMFTDGTISAYGDIDTGGKYRMGLNNAGGGIPAGTYQVYIANARIEGDPAFAETMEDGSKVIPLILAIDPKFGTVSQSGLNCEVKGKTTFNISVEKPPASYNPYLTPN